MLKDLTFEMVIDEDAANKDITERYSYLACQTIPFSFLIFVTDFSLSSKFDIFLSILSISLMSLYIFLISQKPTKDEKSTNIAGINKNIFYKIVLEIILCNEILLSSKNEDLSYNDLLYYYVFSYFYSLTFQVNIVQSIEFNFFKSVLLMINCTNNTHPNVIVRFLCDFFSYKIILVLGMTFFLAFFEYFINKVIREFWALYDSFKRSYCTMKKCLMDEHPIPSILVTNKRANFYILHKNVAAQELFAKSAILKPKEAQEPIFKKSYNFKKDSKSSSKNSSEIVNLEDLFTSEMETSFCAEMEKCICNRKKYFDFPLKVIEKSTKWVVKQAEGKQTFFKGDLDKYEWYRVILSPCNWKNQEAIFIQLIKNREFHANEFVKGYFSEINEQMNILVDNSEIVCNKIIEYEFEKSRDKSISDMKYTKNSSFDGPGLKSSPKFLDGPPRKTPEFVMQNNNSYVNNSNNSFKTKAPSAKKIVSINQGASIRVNTAFPNFDHSLLLFFKYNTNFLYDMNLTGQLYYSFLNKKIFPSTETIRLKEFLNYFVDYFYLISKVNNFKLVLKNLCDEEIVVSYYYFRTIIFNVLLFISNNSNSSDEKVIEINVKSERNFESKQDMFNFQFEIKYYDSKLKMNYNTLREILSIENTHNQIEIEKDISKIKCVDLGMVLTNYILNYVYDNNLIMVSYGNNHSLAFYMKGYVNKSSFNKFPSGSGLSSIKLKEPRTSIFEQYQSKILHKVYKLNPPVVPKIVGVREKLWKIETKELKKGFTFVDNIPNEVIEIEEKYDPKVEESITIENDNNLVKDINISLFKHLKEHEKLIKQKKEKNIDELIEKLKEKGKKRKFIKEFECPININLQLRWDSNMADIVRFFYPPRILIVEDTSLGRVALIGILRCYKLNVLIDIAACGYEAIQKYKFFLRKGFIYDTIFMDYNLPDMLGSEATQLIRDYEVEYSLTKTNICAVSVDPERIVMKYHLFDGYIEKPVRNEQFYNYITTICGKNGSDIKSSSKSLNLVNSN